MFDSVLISLTDGCSVGCRHCGYIGSRRSRDAGHGQLAKWLQDIAAFGVPSVIFTGGEPFERLETLYFAAEEARRMGLRVSVFTSAIWAHEPKALPVCRTLEALGPLETMYISSDIFHQERIPFDALRDAAIHAKGVNGAQVMICITYTDLSQVDAIKSQFSDIGHVSFYASPIIPSKFNSRLVNFERDGIGLELAEHNFSITCHLRTPLVAPSGQVFACHVGKVSAHGDITKSPYYLGDLNTDSFGSIIHANSDNSNYQFLRTHGPRGIASIALNDSAVASTVGRRRFSCGCDLCYSVLRTESGREALNAHVKEEEVLETIHINRALRLRDKLEY